MGRPEVSTVSDVHNDPDLFRAALSFTAAETRFPQRLVEKDYFCSVLLSYLAAAGGPLVFKGGTCLAKVHAGFYRISEDLDFAIPMPTGASRSKRRSLSAGLKEIVSQITHDLSFFRMNQPLTGANNSTQYTAVIAYTSQLSRLEETVKIEVGLREPLLKGVYTGEVHTVLRNPISNEPMVPAFVLPCISLIEAMAEKLRAALSRREAAIRDFYDIDYAMRKLDLKPMEGKMIELIRQKLHLYSKDPIDVSGSRLIALQKQLATQLKPILRTKDFAEFDLERAFRTVTEVAFVVGEPSQPL